MKKIILVLTIGFVFCLLEQPSFSLEEINITNVTGDTYVIQDLPNNNADDGVLMFSDNPNYARRIYIKFYVKIKTNIMVNYSKLCLYYYTHQTDTNLSVYHVYNTTWNEGTLTWNNQPCGTNFNDSNNCNLTAESTITLSGLGLHPNKYICLNVTNIVKKSIESGNYTISFALKTPETNPYGVNNHFYSSESDYKPYLYIRYSSIVSFNPSTTQSGCYSQNWIFINCSIKNENTTKGYNFNGTNYTNFYDWDDSDKYIWIQNSSIVNGLSKLSMTHPTFGFNVTGDNKWIMITYRNGTYHEFKGYYWNGMQWIENSSLVNGLPSYNWMTPELVYNFSGNNTWTLFFGDDGKNVRWYEWNGTQWIGKGSFNLVLYQKPSPTFAFNMTGDNKWIMIVGHDSSAIYSQWKGYYWNGTQWIQNNSLVSGLPLLGNFIWVNPKIFKLENNWVLISGTTKSGKYIISYYWNGSRWIERNFTLGIEGKNYFTPSISFNFTGRNKFDMIAGDFDGYFYGYELNTNDPANYWVNKTGLTDGNYSFYCFVNDSINYNQTEIRNVTLDTTPPTILSVNYPTSLDPIENSNSTLVLNFTASDQNLNDSSAQAIIKIDSTTHINTSCIATTINSTTKRYDCNIDLTYYDKAGSWNINVSICDTFNKCTYNDSNNFIYNQLKAFIVNTSLIDFGTFHLTDPNITRTLKLTNTGNVNITQINVTGYDLVGVINNNYKLLCSDNIFKVNEQYLINNTAITVQGAYIDVYPNDNYYLNFTLIPTNVPVTMFAQEYKTLVNQKWLITV